ncbi:hypothetical protein [Niallia oryzisoli]|uniref:hypothetical protein n=1 Tax=Niallia oryzisoli TaxID=1737571 RepID=UPI00373629DD
MIWLLVPISLWIIALIFLGLPQFTYRLIQRYKMKLRVGANSAKQTNPDESIYKSIEEDMLDIFQFSNLTFIGSIIGLVMIALGTVALCVVLLL